MTLLVRRCFQCSAGKSKKKKVSRASASFSTIVTAFVYFAPYSVANRCAASRACSRVWAEKPRYVAEAVDPRLKDTGRAAILELVLATAPFATAANRFPSAF